MDSALETYLRRLKERPRMDFEDDGSLEGMDPGDRDGSLSPAPLALQERPTFGNMLEGNAFQALRTDADWDRRGNDREADLLAEAGGQQLLDGRQPASGLRAALPMGRGAPADEGSGGPTGYLDALRRAQQMDDRRAAFARLGQAGEQFAEVASRGAYKASPLPPMPSEVSKEEKRRAAVAEYLKQQRDTEDSAVGNAYKLALAKRMAQEKPVVAPKPGLTQEQVNEKFAKDMENAQASIDAKKRQGQPKPPKPGKPEKEPKPFEGIAVGYDIDPKRPPSKDQIKDFGQIVASRHELQGMTSRMRKLVDQYKFLERTRPGSGKTAVSTLATKIQVKAKDIAGLGALSGPDMDLMKALVSNPALVETAFTDIGVQLEDMDWWANNAESSKAKAWGFNQQAAATPAGGSTEKALTPEEKKELEELRARKAAQAKGVK